MSNTRNSPTDQRNKAKSTIRPRSRASSSSQNQLLSRGEREGEAAPPPSKCMQSSCCARNPTLDARANKRRADKTRQIRLPGVYQPDNNFVRAHFVLCGIFTQLSEPSALLQSLQIVLSLLSLLSLLSNQANLSQETHFITAIQTHSSHSTISITLSQKPTPGHQVIWSVNLQLIENIGTYTYITYLQAPDEATAKHVVL